MLIIYGLNITNIITSVYLITDHLQQGDHTGLDFINQHTEKIIMNAIELLKNDHYKRGISSPLKEWMRPASKNHSFALLRNLRSSNISAL